MDRFQVAVESWPSWWPDKSTAVSKVDHVLVATKKGLKRADKGEWVIRQKNGALAVRRWMPARIR